MVRKNKSFIISNMGYITLLIIFNVLSAYDDFFSLPFILTVIGYLMYLIVNKPEEVKK